MTPQLSDGDRLLAIAVPPGRARRGSLVVGLHPGVPLQGGGHGSAILAGTGHHSAAPGATLFIKSVSGLPGDVVTPQHPQSPGDCMGSGATAIAVPPDHLYVEGFARESSDSCNWGPVPQRQILGVVLRRVRP
jgi:hypothetical protein